MTHDPAIAVAYLARGADKDSRGSLERFLRSYRVYRPGIGHRLYIIFKGYADKEALESARQLFNAVAHTPVFLEDNSLDIGAYIEWAGGIAEDVICPLNTHSEILATDWLLKLYGNLCLPGVGVVGATASFERMHSLSEEIPAFPNIHIRSTGFMIRRDFFVSMTRARKIRNKTDAFYFEFGPDSMTRQALREGNKVLLVGRNSRGYSPSNWPVSETFRLGWQNNLLIADNQTRLFESSPWHRKRDLVAATWGPYIDSSIALPDGRVKTL